MNFGIFLQEIGMTLIGTKVFLKKGPYMAALQNLFKHDQR